MLKLAKKAEYKIVFQKQDQIGLEFSKILKSKCGLKSHSYPIRFFSYIDGWLKLGLRLEYF